MKRFYRVSQGDMLAGVCTGLAKYVDIDVTLVRLGFVFSTIFFGGLTLLIYLLVALIAPRDWEVPYEDR